MYYQKPVCDCGGELILVVEKSLEFVTKINKNRQLSKKRSQKGVNHQYITLIGLSVKFVAKNIM